MFRRFAQNGRMDAAMDAAAEADRVALRYARFARDEAPGRSETYRAWAAGVAGDPGVCRILATIPASHRQPPLVFAVTRLLGCPDAGYRRWSAWLRANAVAVTAECARRSLQTNEPQRCAALLPALSLVAGPIALLEVGASAGLCLYPDRYSYRYRTDDGGVVALDPDGGESAVVLHSALRGQGLPVLRMPRIAWRVGIDLHPLSAADPADRAWLTTLVWPGETGRAERITAALRLAAADPPRLETADAADEVDDAIARVAASAPRDATLVVATPGVLAHVPAAGRERVIDRARAAGHWITLDAPTLHRGWRAPVGSGWPADAFALALDGDIVAAVDPLGGWVRPIG